MGEVLGRTQKIETKMVSLRVPIEMYKELEQTAENEVRTVTQQILFFIKCAMKQNCANTTKKDE